MSLDSQRKTDEEVDELEVLLQPGREEDLRTFLLLLHPADVADMIGEVDEDTSIAILRSLDEERAAELLCELEPAEQNRPLALSQPQRFARIVQEMDSDDLADFLQNIPESKAQELLAQLPLEDREDVTELLGYDPESAGGIMQTVLVAVLENVSKDSLVADNFNPNFPPDGSAATPQTINGTPLSDTLVGGFGDDIIRGLEGDDTIDGQAGSDKIYGGEGNDVIEGNFGNDELYGDSGNDTITDDSGSNILDGGAGDDNLTSKSLSGDHTLIGGDGRDSLSATGRKVTLDGGEGDDYIGAFGYIDREGSRSYLTEGEAILKGGVGQDTLNVYSYYKVDIDGGEGIDNLYIGYSGDVIARGEDGNDNIQSYGTLTSELYGGLGDDNIYASSQYLYDNAYRHIVDKNNNGIFDKTLTYYIDGGEGDDNLNFRGGTGNVYGRIETQIDGGAGDDVINVSAPNAGSNTSSNGNEYGIAKVTIDGGEGDDEITVSEGLDISITTGGGSDVISLTAKQYRTLLEGARNIRNDNGTSEVVDAKPIYITDFVTGASGDVLDYGDLLRNGTLEYDGSNPFPTGFNPQVDSLYKQRLDSVTFTDDGDGTFSYQTTNYCAFVRTGAGNSPCSGRYAVVDGRFIIDSEGFAAYTFRKVSNTRIVLGMNASASGSFNIIRLDKKNLAPSPPTALRASLSGSSVSLSWTASESGASSYTIKSKTSSTGTYSNVVTSITGTNYTDNLSEGTKWYRVFAVNSDGTSIGSNVVSVSAP